MVLAFACFALLDACAKYLGQWHAITQVVWARYTGHLLLVVFFFGVVARRNLWRTANLRLQLLRSGLLLADAARAVRCRL